MRKSAQSYSRTEKAILEYAGPAVKLDIGMHSANILAELALLITACASISQIILCATLVDSLSHESTDSGDFQTIAEAESSDNLAWMSRSEREALGWLRMRRNQLVHFDGVVTGMSGQYASADKAILANDAEKALQAILPLLEEREIVN